MASLTPNYPAMKRFLLPIALLTLTTGAALAQRANNYHPGFTYEVKPSLPGKRVVVCTQQSVNAKGELVGDGDLVVQATQIIRNIKAELAKKGMAMTDVTQITYNVKTYKTTLNAKVNLMGASAQFTDLRPGITDFRDMAGSFRDGVLLEVEVVAVK